MTPEQFAYWLHGFAELTGDTPPNAEQWKSIREHLATIFKKVTPPVAKPGQAAGDLIEAIERMKKEGARATPVWEPRFEPQYAPSTPVPWWQQPHLGQPTTICQARASVCESAKTIC